MKQHPGVLPGVARYLRAPAALREHRTHACGLKTKRLIITLALAAALAPAGSLRGTAEDAGVSKQQGVDARLEIAAELRRDDPDIQLELALALMPLQRFEEAERAFRRVLELAPENLDASLGLARLAFFRKEFDKARIDVLAVLAKRPDDAEAKELARQIEQASRPVSTSIEESVEAARLHPDDVELQLQLGLVLTRRNRYPEAERAFSRVLELAPDYLDARLGLARLAFYRKDIGKARADVQVVLAKRPDDSDAKELAREIDRAGGPTKASFAQLLENARLHPDDADGQLQLGIALTGRKRFAEAEKAFSRVLVLAPDYLDARLGLARLAFYREELDKARIGVRAVLAKRPGDGDAKELAGQIEVAIRERAAAKLAPASAPKVEAPELRWKLNIDGGRSHLSGRRDDWIEGDVRLRHTIQPETSITGGFETERRFGVVDTYFEARVDHKAAPWLSGNLFVGGTPNAHYRPEWAGGGGLSVEIAKRSGIIAATSLTLEGRYSEYVTGPVRMGAPGIEQYLFDGRLWLTARWINALDEFGRYRQGYSVRGDAMLRDNLRLFVGYSDAPESSDGSIVETRSLSGGLVYDVNARTELRGSVAHEQRPRLYDRTLISLGSSTKF